MKKVKCIRGDNTPFKNGYIYEVISGDDDGFHKYYIIKGHEMDGGYYQNRFEVVEDEAPPVPVKVLSYECPCGIARVQCDYHKP